MPQFEQIEVFHSLIFWSLVSFALLFFLLKRFAFPPILEVLEERENKIRSEIDDAEKLRQLEGDHLFKKIIYDYLQL